MECYLLKTGDKYPVYALAQVLKRYPNQLEIELIDIMNYGRGSQFHDHWCIHSLCVSYDRFTEVAVEEIEQGLYNEAVDMATTKSSTTMSVIEFVNWFRKAEFGYDLSHERSSSTP